MRFLDWFLQIVVFLGSFTTKRSKSEPIRFARPDSLCTSPHAATRQSLNGFSLNLVSGIFIKMSPHPNLGNSGQSKHFTRRSTCIPARRTALGTRAMNYQTVGYHVRGILSDDVTHPDTRPTQGQINAFVGSGHSHSRRPTIHKYLHCVLCIRGPIMGVCNTYFDATTLLPCKSSSTIVTIIKQQCLIG
jgi:hypothetical protein